MGLQKVEILHDPCRKASDWGGGRTGKEEKGKGKSQGLVSKRFNN